MFGAIKEAWQLARARELRKNLQNLLQHTQFTKTCAEQMESLLEQTDNFKNVSQEGLRKISRACMVDAKRDFDLDMGRGHALALISITVESLTLPGPDAEFLRSASDATIHQAITFHVRSLK